MFRAKMGSRLRAFVARLRARLNPQDETARTAELEPATPTKKPSWAAAPSALSRSPAGALWSLELPEEHSGVVDVQMYASCLTVSVLRYGDEFEKADPMAIYRRAIPLEDAMVGYPEISIVANRLELFFPARHVDFCKKSPQHDDYKWLPKTPAPM